MKPETIEIIRELLKSELMTKKDRMLNYIENGYDVELPKRIAEYRDMFNALEDFEQWEYEQEDGD